MSTTESTDTRTHFRTCPLCEACCGLEITTRGDQVVRIRGDMADPYSKGFICPKGSTLKQLHEDPDRLTAPVIRTEHGWSEVSWDEAFAEVERLFTQVVSEHGHESTGIVAGNPNVHNLGGQLYLGPLIRALQTTNIFSASTVDQMPKHVSSGLMWGDPYMFPLPDIDRSDYLLFLGANPYESNGSLVTLPDFPGHLEAMMERGGKLVVVDPRRTKTAAKASEHLTITPGTDVWWLLALANVLFEEDLVAIGHLEEHISGVDQVRAAIAEFTPTVAAERCGIPEDVTRRIARELAAAPAAAVYGRIGTHTVEFGTLASWAADLLNVLTGNLDKPGGVMFNGAPTQRLTKREPGGRGYSLGRWKGRASGRPEVNGELPAATLAQEMEEPGKGQLRALFLVACNPARSFPNSERISKAFEQLDLFVAIDPYINASTKHAHVILPPTSALERSHYDTAFEGNMVRSFAKYSPAVFPIDRPDEAEILTRLAMIASGMGASADPQDGHDGLLATHVGKEVGRKDSPIFGRDPDEIVAELKDWSWAEQIIDLKIRVGRFGDGFGANPDGLTLKKLAEDHPNGIDFGPLEPRMPSMLKTLSGTVELANEPVMSDLERLRISTLGTGDDLVLVGRRDLRSCNTWMHNVNVLIKGKERCTLQLHPADAERLGVADGGQASVTSRVGSVTAPVQVTDDIMEGVVSLPFGWGYDEEGIEMHTARTRAGVNSNALTDDAVVDDLSGNAVLNAIPVVVAPA